MAPKQTVCICMKSSEASNRKRLDSLRGNFGPLYSARPSANASCAGCLAHSVAGLAFFPEFLE